MTDEIQNFEISSDETSGQIHSVKLYGEELLDPAGRREPRLPWPWGNVTKLTGCFDGRVIEREADGVFCHVVPGLYDLNREAK